MTAHSTSLVLFDAEHTAQMAALLGAQLRQGDAVLLSGGIGAGKTHFARSLIQSLQDVPENVPSPTFTLVQEYETRAGALWHADLYRISGPDEVVELGLTEAMETAICLIEWPDRLAEMQPGAALHLTFETMPDEDQRRLTLDWTEDRWSEPVRSLQQGVTP